MHIDLLDHVTLFLLIISRNAKWANFSLAPVCLEAPGQVSDEPICTTSFYHLWLSQHLACHTKFCHSNYNNQTCFLSSCLHASSNGPVGISQLLLTKKKAKRSVCVAGAGWLLLSFTADVHLQHLCRGGGGQGGRS